MRAEGSNIELGEQCEGCSSHTRESYTPTSIHGACLVCGYQKYPSKSMHSQNKRKKEV